MQILGTIYAAAAGVGLLLGVIHLLVWTRLRDRPEHLFGAMMGFSAGVMALCEASFLGRSSMGAFLTAMEIQSTAVGVMLIGMVWFARLRLGAGRSWLAWAITAVWAIAGAIGILELFSGSFGSIDSLTVATTAWGETYSVPSGMAHPMKIFLDITSLAIVVFVADATLTAARSGRRRVALAVGGPVLFFIVVAGIHTPLVDAGVIQTPYIISLIFAAIALSLALGLVDDVAKAALLTEQLQTEKQRWQLLLDNIDLAVVQTSPDGLITYVNPLFESLSGRRSTDLMGQASWSLVPVSDRAEVKKLVAEAAAWTSRSRVQRRLLTASGAERDMVWFSVALRNERGQPDGVVSIGQDITERLQAEADRDTTHREMEKLGRVLTLGELASTFAHELSQPIAAVLSNAQTLEIMRQQHGGPSDESDQVLSDILRDTRRARDLMKRVREFMFNEEPKTTTFDLADSIGQAAAMVSAEANRRSVSMAFRGGGGATLVSASPLELQQVLLNLLLNAIQAAGDGEGGRVEICSRGNAAGWVMITVDDSGPGLDTTMKEAMFQPFVTSKSKGTGIGLAVAKRIVERHQGTIAVKESSLGGARFELDLPIMSGMRVVASG